MKQFAQVILSIVITLFILEAVFRLSGVAPAGSKFTEMVVSRNGLSTRKPHQEVRVFAYGESTFVGAHYAPASNPVRWLEVYLKDFLPSSQIKVVNFARMGHGSDFTLHTFEETLAYRPDIAVFYLGHNDFLPDERLDEVDSAKKPAAYWAMRILSQSRLFSFFYRQGILIQIRKHAKVIEDKMGFADEIESSPAPVILNDAVSPLDPFYRKNIAFFRSNLMEIIRIGQRHHVKMLFVRPASNLKDFSPSGSDHLRSLKPDELNRWDTFFKQGMSAKSQNQLSAALGYFEKAYALDPTYAELPYQMAKIYFEMGELDRARQLFEAARDHDVRICRATKDVLSIYDSLEHNQSLTILDAEKILSPEVPGGILGEPMVEDNVHFSVRGHSLLARQMAHRMADLSWIVPTAQWQLARERPFDAIAKGLGVNAELLSYAMVKVAGYFGNRFEERLRNASKAVALKPDSIPALRALAWAYWLSGKTDDALKIYAKLKLEHAAIFEKIMEKHPEIRKAMVSTPPESA